MTAKNDTPLKRFTAFWVVLALFALFGVLALIVGLLSKSPEMTAADKAGSDRRLAIRAEVDAAQAANLKLVENGTSIQAPPELIFASFGSKLAQSKPQAVKEERHRDPSLPAPAEVAPEAPAEVAPTEPAPQPAATENTDSPA